MEKQKIRLVWSQGGLWPENDPALVLNRSTQGYLMDPTTQRPWVGTYQQAYQIFKKIDKGEQIFPKK